MFYLGFCMQILIPHRLLQMECLPRQQAQHVAGCLITLVHMHLEKGDTSVCFLCIQYKIPLLPS